MTWERAELDWNRARGLRTGRAGRIGGEEDKVAQRHGRAEGLRVRSPAPTSFTNTRDLSCPASNIGLQAKRSTPPQCDRMLTSSASGPHAGITGRI